VWHSIFICLLLTESASIGEQETTHEAHVQTDERSEAISFSILEKESK